MDKAADTPGLLSGGALCRSRSRYKGNRVKQPSVPPQTTLTNSPEADIREGLPELSVTAQSYGSKTRQHKDSQRAQEREYHTSSGKEDHQPDGAGEDEGQYGHRVSQRYKGLSSRQAQRIETYDHVPPQGVSSEKLPLWSSKEIQGSRNGSIAHNRDPSKTLDSSARKDRRLAHIGARVASQQKLDNTIRSSAQPAVPVEPPRGGGGSNYRQRRQNDSPMAAKPAFDAPISAVNAGERRVAVRYDQSVISVPVTPSTTAAEIVHAAASQLSVPIDSQSTVLMESFGKLGLERPLRKYERIRNVLNSWDDDAQNALMIVPSPTGGKDDDLDIKHVSKQQSGEISLQFYHSQKIGCWDKKWVTLRADGQVSAAKKDGVVNICHLSDFDIYVPTRRQLSKKIRPPRKSCFAIKSQQKSSMFLSTENFVHFFCTKDKDIATQWYKAVQGWRSWYLAHVMGEGTQNSRQLSDDTATQALPSADRHFRSLTHNRPSQSAAGPSVLPSRSAAVRTVSDGSIPTVPSRSRVPPSSSSPSELNKLSTASVRHAHNYALTRAEERIPHSEAPQAFSHAGLLGRTYTQRKQVHQAHGGDEARAQDIPLSRQPTMHRANPRPLVDLTPQYHEPPQHRKGRGIVPDQVPIGGLIEVATSPERAIDIPPATAWQRTSKSPGSMLRSRTVRNRSNSGSPAGAAAKQGSNSPEKSPFNDSGLLAKEDRGQGGIGHGRGVKTGDRAARAPMMDLTEASRYAPGSLLASVERHQEGQSAPVLDRVKKREVNVAVGEGMK